MGDFALGKRENWIRVRKNAKDRLVSSAQRKGNHIMHNFKLGFRNCSAEQQLDICHRVVANLARLPEECQTEPAIAGVADIVAAAQASHDRIQTLRGALKAELSARKDHLRAAREAVTRASLTTARLMQLQPQRMIGAGLQLCSGWQRVGRPDAPTLLRAEALDYNGRVRLRWKRSVRRCQFKIQMTRNPAREGSWQLVTSSSQQSCAVDNLESGGKYWFRVSATNAQGESPWSQPASVRVK